MATQTPKVFISCSIKESSWARQFAEALAEQGIEAWLDAHQIPAGAPVQAEIEKALRESDFIVTIITPESAKAPNLFFELGAAVSMGKTVIPVVPKEMDLSELPPPLRGRQVLVRSTAKETARQLAAQLKPHPAILKV